MALSSNRARYLSVGAFAVTFSLFVIVYILGRWSGFAAVSSVAFFVLFNTLIWFVLLVQFHQRTLAEQEKFDMAQLQKDHAEGTIFSQAQQQEVLAVAQKRLTIMEKWFIPIFAAIIAVYQIVTGLYVYFRISSPSAAEMETQQPLLTALLLIAVAFAMFLLSRYTTGMSTTEKFKPLRAGGSTLLSAAILCFAVSICLFLMQFKFPLPLRILEYVIPVLLVLLGIETALNCILDIYRPRVAGLYSRPAFDSRLLGIVSEPGEVLHTLAGAIDYQFGFKVSETWFYQLVVEKAIVPLILFSAAVLYLLSCFVVVYSDEQAIVERFGNPINDANEVRLLQPGLSVKLPWPIDKAFRFKTSEVKELHIGYKLKVDPDTKLPILEKHLLWGEKHYEQEHDILVASQQSGQQSAGAVPVSLIKANIPVQYRIKGDGLYDFVYNHKNPEELLEAMCYRELARLAASATVEVDTPEQLKQSILGAGRVTAKTILTERIQSEANRLGLGIEIVFVGLQGIHPPVDLAKDYQAVVGAVQQRQAAILAAQTQRITTLGNMAGSVGLAEKMHTLILESEQAVDAKDKDKDKGKITEELDAGLNSAGGTIFTKLAEAKTYAYEKAITSKADSKRFAQQLMPYQAAPEIYKRDMRLEIFEGSLQTTRKYVVVADPNDTQVYIIDLQEKLTPSLYDISGLEEPETK